MFLIICTASWAGDAHSALVKCTKLSINDLEEDRMSICNHNVSLSSRLRSVLLLVISAFSATALAVMVDWFPSDGTDTSGSILLDASVQAGDTFGPGGDFDQSVILNFTFNDGNTYDGSGSDTGFNLTSLLTLLDLGESGFGLSTNGNEGDLVLTTENPFGKWEWKIKAAPKNPSPTEMTFFFTDTSGVEVSGDGSWGPQAVPAPGAMLLMLSGVAGLTAILRGLGLTA
jgi:hypothetical protein